MNHLCLRASTYSSASLTDIKNGIKTALGAQIGGGNFAGFDNGLGTAAGLGGLGAVGAGLALGLAKASKAKGKEGPSITLLLNTFQFVGKVIRKEHSFSVKVVRDSGFPQWMSVTL